MLRTFALTIGLCMIAAGAATAQLPAQKGQKGTGSRPKTAPAGKTTTPEPMSTPQTKLAPVKADGKTKTVAAITDINYMIGVQVYPGDTGLVVMSTVQRRDLDKNNKVRCPAREVKVDFQGNGKLISLMLEAGDVITAIDGYGVSTPEELAVAINSAANPHALDITFIDWRSGNEYTGTIDAMKIK